MSAWLERSERRIAALAVLVGVAFAAWGCLADAPQSRPPEDAAPADTPPPAAGMPDSIPGPAPALEPGAGVPDQGAVAPRPAPEPLPPPVAAPGREPLTPSQAMQERLASRPVAQVVQGLAQLQLGAQLVPADYLRVVLLRPGFEQEALTSASGEFFFKGVPASNYDVVFRTLDKEDRQVFWTRIDIAGGELVRIGPFRIPIEAVKMRK